MEGASSEEDKGQSRQIEALVDNGCKGSSGCIG